jgi:hypothetical protein
MAHHLPAGGLLERIALERVAELAQDLGRGFRLLQVRLPLVCEVGIDGALEGGVRDVPPSAFRV